MKERLVEFLAYLGVGQAKFEVKAGLSRGFVNTLKDNLTLKSLTKIETAYPELNISWLKTGEGAMLKNEVSVQFYEPENIPAGKRVIPLFDDVSTIGGNNSVVANVTGVSQASEYIDPGDWFKSATHAMRHYEDSMIQYPSGCILAMKEVLEKQLIIYGRDYVIETNEYRITKSVQRGKNDDSIRAYSSNTETRPDGTLIHEPLDIAWEDINKIYIVLGYVVKKGSGTIVYNSQR